jgi:hypothetical protein
VHHAWSGEGLSDRLRADATVAFVDMFSLGALDVAFQVRLAHDEICVRILPFARIATSPVLAADTSPVLAAPIDHAMDEDGSDRPEAMPGARSRPAPPRTSSTCSSRSALAPAAALAARRWRLRIAFKSIPATPDGEREVEVC